MNIVFIGGDARMTASCAYLKEAGYEAKLFTDHARTPFTFDDLFENIENADFVVLPSPLKLKDGYIDGVDYAPLEILFGHLKNHAVILSPTLPNIQLREDIKIVCYADNEDYLIENAYLTAEGMLGHLLLNYKKCLKDRNVVIIGYGRLAKALLKLLREFTNNIKLVLRRRELINELKNDGICAVGFDSLVSALSEAEIVINTVPKTLVDEVILKNSPRNITFYELASYPGGIDISAAEKLGISVESLPSLPGKCAPESAGESIARSLIKYFEKGVIL